MIGNLRKFTIFFAIIAELSTATADQWLYVADQNAVDGCGMECNTNKPYKCLGTVNNFQDCTTLCSKDIDCDIVTYSNTTGNCWTRLDAVWSPISSSGTTSGCDTSLVTGCKAIPPYSELNVTFKVKGQVGVPLHPLAPAVALDFWLSSDPVYGEKWENSGILTIDLNNPDLIKYSSAIAPAILRLGGSPEDSITFDTDGTCTPGNGNGPSSNYYCSQVHPYTYGCLTPTRWEQILEFADLVGFKIAFGLNGCFGRESANTPMNFSNAQALMEATANSIHAGAVSFWELSNEVVPNTISAKQWVNDALYLRNLSMEIFSSKDTIPLSLIRLAQGLSRKELSKRIEKAQPKPLLPLFPRIYSFNSFNSLNIYDILSTINKDGIIILKKENNSFSEGINEEDTVLNLAKLLSNGIGAMNTIYGKSFIVTPVSNAVNVAYTTSKLSLHIDLPYYESPPGLQILHCLCNDHSVIGGEATFIDGFHLAKCFEKRYPSYFHILSNTSTCFQKIHYYTILDSKSNNRR